MDLEPTAESDAQVEALARRIADCLEAHLHEYGWEPYRYPSGEHKGIQFRAPGFIDLIGADGSLAEIDLGVRTRLTPPDE